jgi:hypothetical protein
LLCVLFLPEVDAQADWERHGPLRVSANGHYLEHGDGTGFFWLGGTAWRLPSLAAADVDRYLANRAALGFTVVQFVANNMGQPNFAGEYPFAGTGPPWDAVELNEAYWKHVDYIVERAAHHGLHVACFLWWGPSAGDPGVAGKRKSRQAFTDPKQHNYEFGRQLGHRYAEAANLIWVVAGEYHKSVSVMFPNHQRPLPTEHRRRLERTARGILDGDEGHHLMTIHPISFLSSAEEFHDADWLDFNMIQTHAVPSFIVPLTRDDWWRKPPKPTFNAEGWYEGEEELYARWTGMQRADGKLPDPAWVQRFQAYWSVFAGGIGFTYGHRNLWRMESATGERGVLEQRFLDAPGAADLCYLRELIESRPIATRIPAPDLISAGTRGRDSGLSPDLRIATRAAAGNWALVYLTRGSLVRIRLYQLAPGTARAGWYNPRTGKWWTPEGEADRQAAFQSDIPTGPGAEDGYFDPPGKARDGNDWVLVLEVAGGS